MVFIWLLGNNLMYLLIVAENVVNKAENIYSFTNIVEGKKL